MHRSMVDHKRKIKEFEVLQTKHRVNNMPLAFFRQLRRVILKMVATKTLDVTSI